uniref:Putative ovule protein n=1 Tax=Solanum chacoense TaxID=4108 RepID=A0A0V0GTU7_SOLCH
MFEISTWGSRTMNIKFQSQKKCNKPQIPPRKTNPTKGKWDSELIKLVFLPKIEKNCEKRNFLQTSSS